jgi:hypothetical protein
MKYTITRRCLGISGRSACKYVSTYEKEEKKKQRHWERNKRRKPHTIVLSTLIFPAYVTPEQQFHSLSMSHQPNESAMFSYDEICTRVAPNWWSGLPRKAWQISLCSVSGSSFSLNTDVIVLTQSSKTSEQMKPVRLTVSQGLRPVVRG